MSEPTLYLFDGYNLMHAGGIEDRRALIDRLAGWLAVQGARGIAVFDGAGSQETHGPLEVRFAAPADRLIERLASERRGEEGVCLVSSDLAIRATVGQEVRQRSSPSFMRELEGTPPSTPKSRPPRYGVADALDDETRARLDRFRRRR